MDNSERDCDEERERINYEVYEMQKIIAEAEVIDEEAVFLKREGQKDEDGVEEDPRPRETPAKEILWAAENGKIDIINQLLDSDKTLVSSTDNDNYTPLHRACYSNNTDIVKVLLEVGADVGARTCDGWTPLHSACKWNNHECVSLLFDYGADVNTCTDGGQTPLHLASTNPESKETLILLLTHPQIKVNIRNKSGELPFDIAHRHSKYYKLYEITDACLNEI